MAEVLDLKNTFDELETINNGMTDLVYNEVAPDRNVIGKRSLAGATINFKYELDATQRQLINKAYVHARIKIQVSDTLPLFLKDDIAPNMGFMNCMFQNMNYRIAGKEVSTLSDNIPQIGALKERTLKSQAWLKSIGKSTNWWQPTQYERMHQVSIDGVNFGFEGIESKFSETDVRGQSVNAGSGVTSPLLDPEDGTNGQSVAYDFTGGAGATEGQGLVTFAVTGTGSVLPIPLPFSVGDGIKVGLDYLGKIESITATTLFVRDEHGADIAADDDLSVARRVFNYIGRKQSVRSNTFEIFWQPPMSIFDVDDALPVGVYELRMTSHPTATWKQKAIESALATKTPATATVANDYDIDIVKFEFRYPSVFAEAFTDGIYVLDLNEISCQAVNLQSAAFSFTRFDIPESTNALSVAFQERLHVTNTLFSSSKFIVQNNDERKLTRFYVDYAGQKKPRNDADPSYHLDASLHQENYLTLRYADTAMNVGGFFDNGGFESFDDWLERGPYYHFSWPKDGSNKSTIAKVYTQFTGGTAANIDVLLFAHYRKAVHVTIEKDRVRQVNVFDG